MPGRTHTLSKERPLSIVIVGASGDLARKKLIPALFALYSQDFLPREFSVFGFARSPLTDETFRDRAREHLTCRYVPQVRCADRMDEFLARCHYVAGQYDQPASFLHLHEVMQTAEPSFDADRLYYLAIPPSVFTVAAHALRDAGLARCEECPGWARVVMEKPFGRDRASSDQMARELSAVFPEREIYRIDHYLGKEVIQNLMVLRFANPFFEPLWNREHIAGVQICWKENIGIGERGGYFDAFGIIRDVMQNHLLQILSLTAMEEPAGLDPQAVRDEKVRVLRSIPPLPLDELVLGQYSAADRGGRRVPGYTEEPGVRPDSLTPTYAAAVLRVRNDRWDGVPFLLRAGKGLDGHGNEIRLRFKPKARNLFADILPRLPPNQLVIRVQPDEAITLQVVNKVPGLTLALEETSLNLRYQAAFKAVIPDAYECLLLDAIRGDKSLFIRDDELAAAWDIFTPALHETERRAVRPVPYAFGSRGPAEADGLAARHGMECL